MFNKRSIKNCCAGVALVSAVFLGSFDSVKASEELPYFVYKGYLSNAESGDPKAMFYIGLLNEQGLAPKSSVLTAVEWYAKAAEAGSLDGAIAAARLYTFMEDRSQAIEMYVLAANLGSSAANYNLGHAYEYGKGVEKDLDRAESYYLAAAESGMVRAMRQLGMIFWRGEGGKPDIPSAKKWLEKAAATGDQTSIELLSQLKNADETFEKAE